MNYKFLLLSIFISAICINAKAQVPSYVPTNGLVAWYPFNGNANDVSGNNLNGTNNGATLTSDRAGNTNSAYSFNGTSNYIDVADNNLLDFTNQYSISGWIYTTATSGNSSSRTIVSKAKNSTQTGLSLNLDNLQSYKITADNTDGSGAHLIVSDTIPTLNKWYHTVLTYDGTNLQIYINGQLAKSTAATISLLNSTHSLTIGSQQISLNDYFSGKIDDIGLWNRALTQQEITALNNASPCTQIVNVYDTIRTHIQDTITTYVHDTITTHLYVHDTITVNDTIKHFFAVTDTLIINAVLTGIAGPNNTNTIKVFPNPAKDHITINFGNFSTMNGYSIKITNALAQTVYTSTISQQQVSVDLSTWTGNGTYFVTILNSANAVIETRKIILQ